MTDDPSRDALRVAEAAMVACDRHDIHMAAATVTAFLARLAEPGGPVVIHSDHGVHVYTARELRLLAAAVERAARGDA